MENSAISWTHHTFNPWRGCTKVSDGCKFCYADTLSKRNPTTLGIWGPKGTRVIAAESYWKEPLRWNREAQEAGERRRVFCASLADVFEGTKTMPLDRWDAVKAARRRLFDLIEQTLSLDWLLLTKRPENILEMIPKGWQAGLPPNVWIGTSVENQETADTRIPHLLKVPAKVRFLSCEPLLGPVDLAAGLRVAWQCSGCRNYFPDPYKKVCPMCQRENYWSGSHPFNPKGGQRGSGIQWVICGGESGANARPMHPDWARSLRDQCQAAGVKFHFKQWGEYLPFEHTAQPPFLRDQRGREYDGHGLNIIDPETGDVGKNWHEDSLHCDCAFLRVGKKQAGRELDGQKWNELPEVTP